MEWKEGRKGQGAGRGEGWVRSKGREDGKGNRRWGRTGWKGKEEKKLSREKPDQLDPIRSHHQYDHHSSKDQENITITITIFIHHHNELPSPTKSSQLQSSSF